MTDLLRSVIKVKPYDLNFEDKIMSPASGLTITAVTVQATTNGTDWLDVITWTPADFATADAEGYYGTTQPHPANWPLLGFAGATMNVTTNSEVRVDISNCTAAVTTRFDTHVHDDGTFCTSENAEYNQQTGKFEKNPNDGRAKVGVIMGGGGSGMDIDGDAETSIPWRYTAYEIRGHVNGDVGGEIYVGGTRFRTQSFREYTDVPVYYRAKGGYRLTALRIDTTDHNSVDELAEHATSWTFKRIEEEHDVYVTFTSYFGDTVASPAEYVYDGAVHVYPVELVGWEDIYSTEVRYSTNPDADDDEWLNAEDFCATNRADATQTCVGTHTYYYRVFAFQPGYGDTFADSGWVWVDTGVRGSDTVTITPAPLVISANSFKVSWEEAPAATGGYTFTEGGTGWHGFTVEGLCRHYNSAGELVDDVIVTNGTVVITCPTYERSVGQYQLMPANAPGKADSDIDPTGNYTIEFRPGAISVVKSPMVIGGVKQFGELNPEDPLVNTGVKRVEKTYDSEPTNLVVAVETPSDPKNFHIQYSTDGASWSDTNPTFTHVGTYKVWYSVTSGADFGVSDFFYVTNYNYVVISPVEIELTSGTATKTYDGSALTCKTVELTDGELFDGDTLDVETTGGQTDVGSSANTFSYTITSGDGTDHGMTDYTVTKKEGTLTVTPARIVIDGTEHPDTTDPTKARDYGDTGVEDVTVTYDGTGWNVTVKVDAPIKDAVVRFSTNKTDAASWSSSLAFTEVGEYIVYFSVDAPNYASVTNFARVTINPAQATVTADDKFILQGEDAPEYTATVSGLVLRDAGRTDLIEYPTPGSAYTKGSADGEYEIVFADKSEPERQGNYIVTFVPGTLYVDRYARVGSLWITDHRDLGDGANAIALAFKPTLSSGELTAEAVRDLANGHKIKVARAADEESLRSAVPTPVELLDAENLPDLDKGWIWVKVPVDLNATVNDEPVFKAGEPVIWKITIDR